MRVCVEKGKAENDLSCCQSSNCHLPPVPKDLGSSLPEQTSLTPVALTLFNPCQLLSVHQAHEAVLGVVHTEVKGYFTEALDVRPGLSL